jgi:hypothetical protein
MLRCGNFMTSCAGLNTIDWRSGSQLTMSITYDRSENSKDWELALYVMVSFFFFFVLSSLLFLQLQFVCHHQQW